MATSSLFDNKSDFFLRKYEMLLTCVGKHFRSKQRLEVDELMIYYYVFLVLRIKWCVLIDLLIKVLKFEWKAIKIVLGISNEIILKYNYAVWKIWILCVQWLKLAWYIDMSHSKTFFWDNGWPKSSTQWTNFLVGLWDPRPFGAKS